MIKFTSGTSYFKPLGVKVWTFNLPSGYSCPGALLCKAWANRDTGKLKLGPHSEFTCYSARVERFPSARNRYWENFDTLRGQSRAEMAQLLLDAFPDKATHVRIHMAGDFFHQDYFDAWLEVARFHPSVTFWAFTKSLPLWIARLNEIPDNLTLTASYGGLHDDLIEDYRLKYAKVVKSDEVARELGLYIDTDDWLAMTGSQSFALLEK